MMLLKGGSMELDGEGTLVTTEQRLLNRNRNPGKSREAIEWHLREYLNVDRAQMEKSLGATIRRKSWALIRLDAQQRRCHEALMHIQ
jgi:hypothetical protein